MKNRKFTKTGSGQTYIRESTQQKDRSGSVCFSQWKLHVQVRGSHCSAPFPDPNCYNDNFENATVRKTPLFAPFIYKNEHLLRQGSGQT
jgi:hypothetical protein